MNGHAHAGAVPRRTDSWGDGARRRLLSSVLAGVVMAVAPSAAAAPTAQESFEEGRALVKDGRPAEAVPKFLDSIARERTAVALLNLGDAYERVGKSASAHARFVEAEALARDKEPARAEEARKRAKALEPRLGTITVVPPRGSADVRVWIDGVPVEPTSFGKPLPYDPGEHEVVVDGAAGPQQKKVVAVVEARGATVTLDVEPRAPLAPEQGPPRVAERPSGALAETPASPLRTVGLAAGAVGVAGLIAGGIFGALALSSDSDLRAACPAFPSCPPSRREELTALDSDAHAFASVSTVMFVAGAALLAAGAFFFFGSGPARSATTTAVSSPVAPP